MKKLISLGLLVAVVVLWAIAPVYDYFILSMSSVDLMTEMQAEAPLYAYLLVFVPLVTVILGIVGTFLKGFLSKIAGLIGAVGYVLAVVLHFVDDSFDPDIFGWGVWALLVVMIVNLVLSLVGKKQEA